MESDGITAQIVKDAINVRQQRLFRGRDAIFPCVAGALTLVILTATVITIGIYARKYKWMPVKGGRIKTVDGEKVRVVETQYDSGPALFGSFVGIFGNPLLSAAAGGLACALMCIPKGIKWKRLENQKNAVTEDSALEILRPHIRHLPDSALLPCVRAMTREQMLQLQPAFGHKRFWRLATAPDTGPERMNFQLEHNLDQTQDIGTFIEKHAEQLHDFDPERFPLPAQAEEKLPDLDELDTDELKKLITQEQVRPNASLRRGLKDAVRERLEDDLDGWEEFFDELSGEVEYTAADYCDSWDRCYGDLLDLISMRKPSKPVQAKPENNEVETALGAEAIKRLERFGHCNDFIEECLKIGIEFDFSEETEEIKKGLNYLEKHLLDPGGGYCGRVNRMFEDKEAPIKHVIAACKKYQFHRILQPIEKQLHAKIANAANREEQMRWFAYMPDSLMLRHRVALELKGQRQADLLNDLLACESDLEYWVLREAIQDGYSKATILAFLQQLDERIEGSPIDEPDLKALVGHEERLCALRDYEIRSGREIRDCLRNRLVRDLRENELLGKDADWFKQVWAYAEQQNDQALKAVCAKALARVSDAAFQEKLPDLWDGRFPPTLYSGWRRNPIHEAPMP